MHSYIIWLIKNDSEFQLSGEVNVHGSIAYVSQQAWLRNATLRENILFGKAFDQQRSVKICLGSSSLF